MGKCVTAFWVVLTILFTLAICFSFISPVWFQNEAELKHVVGQSRQISNQYDPVALGMIRFCHRYQLSQAIQKCGFFTSLKDMPSIAWMVSAIIYAIGCVFFIVSVIMAFISICTKSSMSDKLKVATAYIQVIGVGFLAIAVLIFPLGLDSSFARDVCGLEAKMFVSGECQVAWGYVLAIMSVSLTIFCPILAKYSTENKETYRQGIGTGTYSEYDYQKSEVISLTTSSTSTRSKVMTTV